MNRFSRHPAARAALLAVIAAGAALPCAAGRVKEYGGGTELHGLAVCPPTGTPFFTGYDDALGYWANGGGSGLVVGATDLRAMVGAIDGNFYAVDTAGNKIWRLPYNGNVGSNATPFSIPTPSSQPTGITIGPDGAVWFTELAGNKIGRLSLGGTITEFPLPNPVSQPKGITNGFDGYLYFVEYTGNRIGRITPSGIITEYPIPTGSAYPTSLAAMGGRIAFTETGQSKIGIFYTSTKSFKEIPTPTYPSSPQYITAAPYVHWYFTEALGNAIGRMDLDGSQITEYPLPAPDQKPRHIAYGNDETIWFLDDAQGLARYFIRIPGDANDDGEVDVADVFYVINFLFSGGPAPK